ncbi:hypothetical protein FRX31_013648 [Thalictrum thalictroides]|uniref:Uncharacterized protein n=1 Tax=Thalictrum thalictroides TaxID=46969 RepID=A0A7J6WJW9_THATH|nr:hypothetical protein FRX31_013648 [Thalictrum thalictroides]
MDPEAPTAFREQYFGKRKNTKEYHIAEAIERARIDSESGDDKHCLNRLLLVLILKLVAQKGVFFSSSQQRSTPQPKPKGMSSPWKKTELPKKVKPILTKPKPALAKRKATTDAITPTASKAKKAKTNAPTPRTTSAAKKGKIQSNKVLPKKLSSPSTPRTPTSDKKGKGKEKMLGSPLSTRSSERLKCKCYIL